MKFIGQRTIIEGFKDKIANNTLSHAYTLTGPVGIGKKSLAHYLAKMILCTGTTESAPCGKCRSCKSFQAGSNPQFMAVRSSTQKILIKQIRELIDDIGVRPSHGRKVYVIEDADRMTVDAQNCLLKTLEEPPEYAVIFLTTAYFESLIVTVRSRVVQLKLQTYSTEELKEILEMTGIDARGKEHLLKWSMGVPGRAIDLISDSNFEKNREMVMKFVFEDELSMLDFNQYLSGKKEVFTQCMDILETVYRDILFVLYGLGEELINCDKKDKILEYAKSFNSSDILDKISKISDIRANLKRNMNYQLAVDMVTLELK